MSMLVLKDMSIDWTTTTVIRAADSDGTGSQVRVGEKYTLNNLWDASLIGSSNIAVRALVHASGLSIDEFAARMDAKARELNLATLHFVEPTGLSAENVGNAEDIVGLLQVALQDKKIVQTLAKTDYFLEPVGKPTRRVWSTDMLLTDWIPNDFGHTEVVGKTGHIEDSGYNFVVRLRQSGGQAIRVVVLGADSNEKRFLEARDIGEWIFAHYVWPEEEEYRVVAFQNDN
jgi:D-alanyl-D-alanine endopeptidase (penicillin-binding protein 7)